MSRGFGATLGAGTTDRIATLLTTNATLRSYYIRFNRNGAGGGNRGTLFIKPTDGGLSMVYLLIDNASSTLEMFFERTTLGGGWTAAKPSDSAWHDVLITYDAGSTSNDPVVYVNGSSVTVTEVQTPSGAIVTSSAVLGLGNNAAGTRNVDGMLAEFAVWDRILTAGEAAGLGKGFTPDHYPQSLVCYEPMLRANVNRKLSPSTITATAVQPHPRVITPWRGNVVSVVSGGILRLLMNYEGA